VSPGRANHEEDQQHVEELNEKAKIPFTRIVEALDLPP
jgi:hypothetical protein